MELKAIIGREKNKPQDWNFENILSYLSTIKAKLYKDMGSFTNANSVDEFSRSETICKEKKENFYIHVSGLTDASDFYSYLTSRGFIIKDSKLKPRK